MKTEIRTMFIVEAKYKQAWENCCGQSFSPLSEAQKCIKWCRETFPNQPHRIVKLVRTIRVSDKTSVIEKPENLEGKL